MPQKESLAERRARRGAIEEPSVVLNAAARFLEARARSVAEVRRHLVDAGYRPTLVDGAVERLLQIGYLDDLAFARAWVASRDRARPRGERALRTELVRKGIADETVRTVLGERGGHADADVDADAAGDRLHSREGGGGPSTTHSGGIHVDHLISADEAAAERLIARKAATLGREADGRLRRQKAYALLARNGFDPDVAARVSARVGVESTLPFDPD